MLLFSSSQVEDMLDIIRKHHTIFVGGNIGTEYLSSSEKDILRNAGIDLEKWENQKGYVEEAFAFGMLSSAISSERADAMNYKDFKKFVQSKNYVPLTIKEKSAISHLKFQSFSSIKNLENRVIGDFNNIMIDNDKSFRSKFEEVTREAAIKTVEFRGTARDMVSEMGEKTQYWERDLGRIAETTLHNAYEEGRASQIERVEGKDAKVYKDVFPGSCDHCIRLFLTAGAGSEPIIFKLSELRANGSNAGKKVTDWVATLSGTHPYCRCQVRTLPQGYVWNEEKGKFVRGKREFSEKIRNRAKVSLKIGNKEYQV